MKTLKKLMPLKLQDQKVEVMFIKSLVVIEKTYLAFVTGIFALAIVHFIKAAI